MELTLTREAFRPDATVGVLTTPFGRYFTMERPWLDNASGISCIPEGSYECFKRWSNKLQRFTYGLKDVPSRGNILIHNGSFIEHSLGCILIGKTRFTVATPTGSKRGIGLSRVAFTEFLTKMEFQPFTLHIVRQGDTNA